MKKDENFYDEQSYLMGNKTLFKDISCKGAKFDNVINTTECKLPSAKALVDDGEQNSGFFKKLFGFFGS